MSKGLSDRRAAARAAKRDFEQATGFKTGFNLAEARKVWHEENKEVSPEVIKYLKGLSADELRELQREMNQKITTAGPGEWTGDDDRELELVNKMVNEAVRRLAA